MVDSIGLSSTSITLSIDILIISTGIIDIVAFIHLHHVLSDTFGKWRWHLKEVQVQLLTNVELFELVDEVVTLVHDLFVY